MLKILREQLDHFARKARRDFAERVVLHIDLTYPELAASMPEDVLRARVEDGMDRAERYGIVMEEDAVEFILMLFALGPAADEEIPWVRAILRDRDLDGGGKMKRLEEAGRRERAAQTAVEEGA
ncbi:Hypothetical protein A7982_11956 [Minicystis rosea]|nr:Hypothetical protein A7982_11956 [Minicystis rosea]